MAWFAANWFSVLILIAVIAMHMFGHGGHGGHGGGDRQRRSSGGDKDKAHGQALNTRAGGHQH